MIKIKIKDLPDYMKIIDIEEVENGLNRNFDMDENMVNIIMSIIKPCILDEEEIKNQVE